MGTSYPSATAAFCASYQACTAPSWNSDAALRALTGRGKLLLARDFAQLVTVAQPK